MLYFFRLLIILLKGIIPRFAFVISMVWLVSAVSFRSFRSFRFGRFARFGGFGPFVSVVSLASFRSFRSFRWFRFAGFVSLFRVLVHAIKNCHLPSTSTETMSFARSIAELNIVIM